MMAILEGRAGHPGTVTRVFSVVVGASSIKM
jgi:hypothetical protein